MQCVWIRTGCHAALHKTHKRHDVPLNSEVERCNVFERLGVFAQSIFVMQVRYTDPFLIIVAHNLVPYHDVLRAITRRVIRRCQTQENLLSVPIEQGLGIKVQI